MSGYTPSWLARALYGPAGRRPAGHMVLFRATDKPVYWIDLADLANLDENAGTLQRDDLYLSICAQNQEAALKEKQRRLYEQAGKQPGKQAKKADPKYTRGFNATVCAVPAVWFELDYRDGGAHKEAALPTRQEAESFIDTLPLEPTVIVASGHGFHLYWCFNEPFLCAADADRTTAAQLVKEWQSMIQERAADYEWRLDSTHDLTRVLRPPGTLNHKSEPPKPVTVLRYEEGNRYTFPELQRWIPAPDPVQHHSNGRGFTPEVEDVREMLAAINTRPGYRDWFRISASVLDAVGGDIDLAESLLKGWRPEEEEGEYRRKLESGLNGSISTGTLVYLARQHGWQPDQAKAPVAYVGSSLKRKAEPSGDGQAGDEPELAKPKRNAVDPDRFWKTEDEGKEGEIDPRQLVDWLSEKGFRRLYPPGTLSSLFVHQSGQIIDEVSAEIMKDAVADHLANTDEKGKEAAARTIIKKAHTYFSRHTLEFLKRSDAAFQRDTKGSAFFYFSNSFVHVTADGVEKLPYSELTGNIWKKQIIPREISIIPSFDEGRIEEAEFGQFMYRAMGKTESRLLALMSSAGHLLHGFKNRSEAKAICFTDEAISDDSVPNGRAGKGLLTSGIAEMVPTVRIDAKNFRFDSSFPFQSVTLGTRVLDFNDVPKNFPFERTFGLITEDMQVEKKGRDQFTISFDESPKLVLSTNYVLKGEGGSHVDRLFEVEFSDHYNARHKPIDEFGHLFFYDWSQSEWNLFYNTMLACVRVYLRDGLIGYEHVNLERKKLIQMTSTEFAEFVEYTEEAPDGACKEVHRYRVNAIEQGRDAVRRIEYNKQEEFKAFCEANPDTNVEQKDFTRWLKTYARVKEWRIEERRANGGKDRFIWFTSDL